MRLFALAVLLAVPVLAQEPRRPRITGVAHVALWVHDVEKARAYYKDFLGYAEPFDLKNADGSLALTFIKIGDRQYIELFPEREPGGDRLNHIAFETDDAEALRVYLSSRGVAVPEKANRGRIGNTSFNVRDPEGHVVEFVQYEPGGWSALETGRFLPAEAISRSLRHVGVLTGPLDPQLRFYRDVLGFRETWRGSRDGQVLNWVNLQVPDGGDYLELMLYRERPAPGQRGSQHHICLEVDDVTRAAQTLAGRAARVSYPRPLEVRTGINRRRQLNVFDPDGTRTELMEPGTVDGTPTPSSTAPPPEPAAATASAPDVEERVASLLRQMTLEEKLDLLGGVDGFFVRGVPRLGVPRLKMADGPMGVRNFGPATAMPGGIALAATWNTALAERVGVQMGRDARAKGVHFLLGPGVNIYRAPMNGRNFEYYGEDPLLAGRVAAAFIRGVQAQGVSATVKHYLGNNSEFDRHKTDSVIDERALREIYAPAFEAAVREARTGALMTSYNLTNGTYMSQHAGLVAGLLKKEWGFDGLVMSDWTSTYDGLAAANAGLDLEMPSGVQMNRKNLEPALVEGKVTLGTIDDKVRRLLRVAVRFGWLDREQTDPAIPRYNLEGREAALQAAREGMVLLRNEGGLLPLDRSRVRSVAVIGPNAHPAVPVAGGSARVEPFHATSFVQGLAEHLGGSAQVLYHRGLPSLTEMASATRFVTAPENGEPGLRAEYFDNAELKGTPVVVRTEPRLAFAGRGSAAFPDGTQSDRWTGYFIPAAAGSYEVFVRSTGEDGGYYRLLVDDRLLLDNDTQVTVARTASLALDTAPHKLVLEHRGRSRWLGARLELGIVRRGEVVDAQARALAARADAVIVAVGFDPETESEAADRTFRLPPGQDELIREMAAANPRSVVVITSGGGVDMREWIDRVPAVMQAWYSGQEAGRALAELVFGEVNPSGRLPATFERRFEDNPVAASYYPEAGTRRVVYGEGVFVGYRGYERSGTKPLFPFGYGLSYTTFGYANLALTRPSDRATSAAQAGPLIDVTFEVTNTGLRAGSDVAQVYVSERRPRLPRPPKELRAFAKVGLAPGETRRVTLGLDPRAFAYWDTASGGWRVDPGEFEVLVGRSSEDVVLSGPVTLTPAEAARAR